VRVNEIINIGDNIACEVKDAYDGGIIVEIKTRGILRDFQKMYLPSAKLDLQPITERDEKDIAEFACHFNFDILVVSGLRKEKDIEYAKYVLKQNKKEMVHVYVKIENHEALFNYEKILAAADGVIVCRTSLAAEISGEKLYIAQKWMIEKAN
jgi:pyruvate kinase